LMAIAENDNFGSYGIVNIGQLIVIWKWPYHGTRNERRERWTYCWVREWQGLMTAEEWRGTVFPGMYSVLVAEIFREHRVLVEFWFDFWLLCSLWRQRSSVSTIETKLISHLHMLHIIVCE
jgi:hypothetical protein